MNNENFITNIINNFFYKSQELLRPLVSASLFLQRFDYCILLLMIILFAVSLFANTTILGIISGLIIILTILKLFFIRGQNIELNPSGLILLGFLAICLISVFFSPYIKMSFTKGFLYYLLYIAFYFSMVQFFRFNKNKMVPVVFIIMFLIAFEAGIAIIQSINPFDVSTSWQDTSYINAEETLSRVYGTLKPYNPNLLCGYLLVGLSSIITVSFWAVIFKHRKTFIFSIVVLILTFCAIFATGTRSGYIGLFMAVIIGFFLTNKLFKNYLSENVQKIWKSICTSIMTFGGIIIVLTPSIFKRILSIFIMRKDSSTSFRMNVYQAAWQMFVDNWFSGIGPGHDTFRNVYGLYMTTGFTALSAYSIYLEIAVESGIFALLFFITFFIMLIKASLKFIKQDNPIEQKAIIIPILIMMTAVFTQGFFDTLFFRPQLQFLFWTNIAILSVIIYDNKNNDEKGLQENIQYIIMNLSNFVTNKIGKITKGV